MHRHEQQQYVSSYGILTGFEKRGPLLIHPPSQEEADKNFRVGMPHDPSALFTATGLFIASVFSFTPLNFGYDGPIIKPYEYVIDEALRIFLRYDSACFMAR